MRFPGVAGMPVAVAFDGGRVTSDGGVLWLQEVDATLGLCAQLAACVPEWRRGPVRHRLEDQDDADTLRTDPLLKLVCGRLPESGVDLASQPTLSRFENAVDAKACYRLGQALVELYLRERERAGVPQRILVDVDSTDDPTHGAQEGTAYHGYYRQHMYHPLLIFDGDTDQLITAVLRAGNVHASRGIVGILRRIVVALRQRWPGVAIEVRADSGFAIPALYDYCEREQIAYTIGLIPNARLEAAAESLLEAASARQQETGVETVRLVSETVYQAESWDRPRRVVYKAEALRKGPNTRFVVTNRPDDPRGLYDWYVARGETENWIKDFTRACFADRLSCHRFWANQFRLLLHAAAYWLLDTLRRWLQDLALPRMQLGTLRLQVLKVGGWVRQWLTRVRIRLASSHPSEAVWRRLAMRPGRPAPLMNNPG